MSVSVNLSMLLHSRLFHPRALRGCGLVGLCAAFWSAAMAAEGPRLREFPVAPDVSVPVSRYPAAGAGLLLWLPSEVGLTDADHQLAAALAARGLEVWVADLLAARLLPALASGLAEVPDQDVAALIEQAGAAGKRVVVLGAGQGAATALGGAAAFRRTHPDRPAPPVLLISPHLYTELPEPGRDARYLPVLGSGAFTAYILQPALASARWWLDRSEAEFRRGGGSVRSRVLPQVRDRFYFRPDATAAEQALAGRLPELLRGAVAELVAEEGQQP